MFLFKAKIATVAQIGRLVKLKTNETFCLSSFEHMFLRKSQINRCKRYNARTEYVTGMLRLSGAG